MQFVSEHDGTSRVFIQNQSNNNRLIASTNYWGSNLERNGEIYLSFKSGCIRLLLPERLADRKTGNAQDIFDYSYFYNTSRVDILRGELAGSTAFDLLFEDGTHTPYVVRTTDRHWERLMPPCSREWCPPVHIYRRTGLIRTLESRYRSVSTLPKATPRGTNSIWLGNNFFSSPN